MKKCLLPLTIALLFTACSSGPPDQLITDNVSKMAAVDRSLGFSIEVEKVQILKKSAEGGKTVVVTKVTGWATHPELHIGATLPAEKERKNSWAEWQFVLVKRDKQWIIEDKFKTNEGFF